MAACEICRKERSDQDCFCIMNLSSYLKGDFLIIGSYALKTRRAKDIDIMCNSDQLIGDDWSVHKYGAKKDNIDVLFIDNHPSLLEEYTKLKTLCGLGASYEFLYILKASHIHLPRRNWFADIQDFHILRLLAKSDDRLEAVIEAYRNELDEISGTHTMNLKTTKEDFFSDGVRKFIDHDLLHDIVAHENIPIFKKTQYENDEVYCNREKFLKLSILQQRRMVLEEVYVICLERFIIPSIVSNKEQRITIELLNQSMKKVCTTLSSGWFREFSVNNYYDIANLFDIEYLQRKLEIVKTNLKE